MSKKLTLPQLNAAYAFNSGVMAAVKIIEAEIGANPLFTDLLSFLRSEILRKIKDVG